MPADHETGLSFLFDTAYRFQPEFHRYVSNYVEFLKLDNPYMDETQMSVAQQTLKVEFYRLCLESLGLASFDGLLILDNNGLLLEINGMAEKTLGVKRMDVLGQPFFQRLFPETQKDSNLIWIQKNAKITGEVFRKSTEMLMVKSSGTMFPTEVKVTELKIFGSALLVLCFNDITRRKWMDQALKYTEERYRKIMGENADAICLIDPYNKRIEESNPAFNVLLGYSDDELFALRLYDVMEGDHEDIDAWVDKRMRQGTSLLFREQGKFFTRNQIPVDVEFSCSIFDLRDHPLLCIIIRDTAPREYVVRRTLADSQVENIERHLGRFGELLQEFEQTKLSKAQQEIMAELHEHHHALFKETEREASEDDGPLPMRQYRQAFTLKTVLFHIQSLFQHALDGKELTLTISVEPDVPDVLIGDPLKLQEVIYHIIENAIAHTGEGDLLIKVRLTQSEYSTATILFTIRDGGGGIPAITKAKISDVFSSDKPLETGEKYGIRGLTLCAHYIKALNGRIWFNTLEGKGSSFLFSLPLELTEQEADDLPELSLEMIRQHLLVVGGQIHDMLVSADHSSAPAPEPEAKGTEKSKSKVKPEKAGQVKAASRATRPSGQARELIRPLSLLLVEQDFDNVIALQTALAGQTVEMRMVDNGRKALEMVREKEFDLILMGLELPVMDGYAAAASMRDWEREAKRGYEMLLVALVPEGANPPSDEQLQDFDRSCPTSLNKQVVDELLSWAQARIAGEAGPEVPVEVAPEPAEVPEPEPVAAPPAPEPEAHMPEPEAETPEPAPQSPSGNGEGAGSILVHLNADMARLAPDFLAKRRQDVEKLRKALQDNKIDSVRVLGKSMKGTGGVYGFNQIAEIGKDLEAAAGSKSADAVKECLMRLEDFLERVEIVAE